MQCHLCPQFKVNLENAKRGIVVDYQSTRCSSCQLVEDSTWTREFDEKRADARQMRNETEEAETEDVMLPCATLSTAMHVFLDLPQPAFELIRMRREGMTFAQIGETLGVTAQAVEVRLKRLIEKVPSLGELFAGKVRRQRFRRKHRRGEAA